jgi:methionyl-tRNA formyltransferase
MKVLFAGSPAIAVPSLNIIATTHELVGVLTNPESEQGRGRTVRTTEVAAAAALLSARIEKPIPILAPERLDGAARAAVAALQPEILVSFAFGRIFGPKFLALFPRGGINIHPSLLPKYRGSSPIQHAILAGDAETGICVQRIALEMDTGNLLAEKRILLDGSETTASLSERCAQDGARLVLNVLEELEEGRAVDRTQTGEPSWCGKISKDDGFVDWSLPTAAIHARLRAYDPWPGSWTWMDGQRLSILEAHPASFPDTLPNVPAGTIIGVDRSKGILVRTSDGCLALARLQLAARKALSFKDFANGIRNLRGMVLGTGPQAARQG